MGSIAACIEAASAKNETNKCAFVDKGAHVLLIEAICQPGISHDALRPICGALRSFATADDLRPTTSRCSCPLKICREQETQGTGWNPPEQHSGVL